MIEVHFDCGATGSLRRSEVLSGPVLVEEFAASTTRSIAGSISLPPGYHTVAFYRSGTLLARSLTDAKLLVVPPNTVLYLRGGARLMAIGSRADHSVLSFTWSGSISPLLEAPADKEPRLQAARPVMPTYADAIARMEEAVTSEAGWRDAVLVGALHEIVSTIVDGDDEMQLASLPRTLPETIVELVGLVRAAPSRPWPLKEASDRAGYSPFHFSRVFKQIVGYGFHEFVDRTRTQLAVEMLCNTENPVDVVASSCGFGTTQSLRESVKEYLGLVPSELRSLPAPIAYPRVG